MSTPKKRSAPWLILGIAYAAWGGCTEVAGHRAHPLAETGGITDSGAGGAPEGLGGMASNSGGTSNAAVDSGASGGRESGVEDGALDVRAERLDARDDAVDGLDASRTDVGVNLGAGGTISAGVGGTNTVGSGGAAETGAGGATAAGAGGTWLLEAGAGGLCRTGCAVAIAPILDMSATMVNFFLELPTAEDLTGATVTYRFCVQSPGTAKSLSLFPQGEQPNYQWGTQVTVQVADVGCETGMHDVNVPVIGLDATIARWFSIGMTFPSSASAAAPTILYVDSFTFKNVPEGGVIGPYEFVNNASSFILGYNDKPPNATTEHGRVEWIVDSPDP